MFILNIATRVNKTSLIKETYTNSLLYIHNTNHTNYIHVQVVSHLTYLSQEIFLYITYCYTTINLFNQTYFDQRVCPTFSMLDFVKLLLFQFNKYKSLYCTNGNICSHFIIIPFILFVSGQIYDWENSHLFYYFVNKKENLWYKHYSVWGITEGAKPFAIVKCKKKKRKEEKAWARINLYTVCIYRLTQWKCSVQTVVIWDIKTIKYKQ